MIEYYCPACNGTNVEVRAKQPIKVRKPMDEMLHPIIATAQPAIFTTHDMEAHCKDCGHTLPLRKYQPPCWGGRGVLDSPSIT